MDSVYIIKILKLVNTQTLNLLHCGKGKHRGLTSLTSLTIRAKRICSRNNINQEINLIKDYAAWNGCPKRIANSIIKQALQASDSNDTRS